MPCGFVSLTEFYREKAEKLTEELEGEREKAKARQEQQVKRDKKLQMLEQQLRAQEKRYKDEARAFTQTINQLKHELDQKGNTIAHLTSKLHSVRRSNMQEERLSQEGRPLSASSEERDSVLFSPAPPIDSAPKFRRRSTRSSLSDFQAQGLLATSVQKRGPSSRKLSSDQELEVDENVPDPTPFLQSKSSSEAIIKRTERKPLPPISPKVAAPPLHQTGSYKFVRKHRSKGECVSTSSSPKVEVETLAIDHVDDLRRAQEYNSTSADC